MKKLENRSLRKELVLKFEERIVHNSKIRFLIDIVFTIALMTFLYFKIGFWLEGNDDNTIASIVSGHLSQNPSSHVYYPNIMYGAFFKFLYNLAPHTPWYGIIQLVYVFLVIFIMLHSSEKLCKTAFSYLLTMLISSLVIFYAIRMYSFIQFTTISALLAITGYVCLIFSKRERSTYIIFSILEFLAAITRPSPMLMIQPIGYSCFVATTVIAYHSTGDDPINVKDWIKKIIAQVYIPFLCVSLIAGATQLINSFAYKSSEWQSAMDFEYFRTNMNDFYEAPEYEEIESILGKYGITPIEYEAVKTTRIFEVEKYLPVCNEIVEYLKTSSVNTSPSFIACIRWLLADSYRGHSDILVLTLFFLFLVVIINKKWGYASLLIYYVGKLFAWGYVFYEQRFVDRVMSPLYYSEIVFLLCLITFLISFSKDIISVKKGKKTIWTVMVLFIISFSLMIIRKSHYQYDTCKNQKIRYSLFHETGLAINKYCNENPDANFIISGDLLAYWKHPVLSTVYSDKANYAVLGGWFCPSPEAQEYINSYLSDKPTYLMVTTDPVFASSNELFINFCETVLNCKATYVDVIKTAVGDYAQLYKLTD